MSRRRSSVCLAASIALSLVLSGCGGDAKEARTDEGLDAQTSTTSTTVETGPPPGSELVPILDLDSGACFDSMRGSVGEDQAVWQINCNDPHTFETYEVIDYDGDGSGRNSPYPGAAEVRDWSEQACYARFEPFVGVRWTISELDIKVWWPSQRSWDNHDRGVICTLMATNGSELTGTQRGKRR